MGQFGMRNAQFGILGTSLSGDAVLSRCFAFGSRLPCGSVGKSCARFTPVSFPLSGKERRLAVSCVSIPRGSGSPLEPSRMLCGYQALRVHFGIVRFFMAIPTELRTESAIRKGTPFCVAFLLLQVMVRCDTAGSPLGLRAPKPAPKSHWLSGLSSFGSRQSAFLQNIAIIAVFEHRTRVPQHSCTRKDLTGSNLWPVRSGCIAMLSIRTNVQTRSAPKR